MIDAVDLFAGAGGFTTGAEAAGVRVLWAGNHWPAAVACHRANHPGVEHVCQDLHQADWTAVPRHDLLLASPSCTGHAHARGKDRPHHDAARSTAWAVVSCAEAHRPACVVVENVPELRNWILWPAWQDAMRRLGYSLAEHVCDAADFGTPQHRERLIVVGTRSKAPIRLELPRLPHVPASAIVDLDAGRWSTVDKPGRSLATLARIAQGRADGHGDRFLIPFYGQGSGLTGRGLSRPIGTITTRARWAIVNGERMRMLTVDETRRAMGFPDGYRLGATVAESIHLLGNAIPPPMARWFCSELARTA